MVDLKEHGPNDEKKDESNEAFQVSTDEDSIKKLQNPQVMTESPGCSNKKKSPIPPTTPPAAKKARSESDEEKTERIKRAEAAMKRLSGTADIATKGDIEADIPNEDADDDEVVLVKVTPAKKAFRGSHATGGACNTPTTKGGMAAANAVAAVAARNAGVVAAAELRKAGIFSSGDSTSGVDLLFGDCGEIEFVFTQHGTQANEIVLLQRIVRHHLKGMGIRPIDYPVLRGDSAISLKVQLYCSPSDSFFEDRANGVLTERAKKKGLPFLCLPSTGIDAYMEAKPGLIQAALAGIMYSDVHQLAKVEILKVYDFDVPPYSGKVVFSVKKCGGKDLIPLFSGVDPKKPFTPEENKDMELEEDKKMPAKEAEDDKKMPAKDKAEDKAEDKKGASDVPADDEKNKDKKVLPTKDSSEQEKEEVKDSASEKGNEPSVVVAIDESKVGKQKDSGRRVAGDYVVGIPP